MKVARHGVLRPVREGRLRVARSPGVGRAPYPIAMRPRHARTADSPGRRLEARGEFRFWITIGGRSDARV